MSCFFFSFRLLRLVWHETYTDTAGAVYNNYHFRTEMSDTTFRGQECAASPCALATLLFAKYYLEDPFELNGMNVPGLLVSHVAGAIEEAISVYQKNYPNEPVTLQPSDACALLGDHGLFDIKIDESTDEVEAEMLTYYIQVLQPDQALLVCFDFPYSVISIVLTKSDDVIMFNSQRNPIESFNAYKGGFLTTCKKDYNTLIGLLYEVKRRKDSFGRSRGRFVVVRVI